MKTEYIPLHDDDAYIVEELEAEEIELSEDFDPRWLGLSAEAKDAVARYFDSDIDEAIYGATRLVNNFRCPPTWAAELTGPRKGWKDPIG